MALNPCQGPARAVLPGQIKLQNDRIEDFFMLMATHGMSQSAGVLRSGHNQWSQGTEQDEGHGTITIRISVPMARSAH